MPAMGKLNMSKNYTSCSILLWWGKTLTNVICNSLSISIGGLILKTKQKENFIEFHLDDSQDRIQISSTTTISKALQRKEQTIYGKLGFGVSYPLKIGIIVDCMPSRKLHSLNQHVERHTSKKHHKIKGQIRKYIRSTSISSI